jgi:hypothetical protein
MKSLLSVIGTSSIDPKSPLTASLERRASFWNFARADYQAAYINKTPTLLDPDDYATWQSCGLQVSATGSLYADPETLRADPCHRNSTVQLVAHTLLWILLRTMNYLAQPPPAAQDLPTRQAAWDTLTLQLDAWHAHLPTTTPSGNRINELFFSIPLCAATLQLYHFARILLLLSKPSTLSRLQAYREIAFQALSHAHAILGIALGRPHPAVRVEMLLPLYAAGGCLEDDGERRLVVEVLRAVERDTGCTTEGRVRELEREWGWLGREGG